MSSFTTDHDVDEVVFTKLGVALNSEAGDDQTKGDVETLMGVKVKKDITTGIETEYGEGS